MAGKKSKKEIEYHPLAELELSDFELGGSSFMRNLLAEELDGKSPLEDLPSEPPELPVSGPEPEHPADPVSGEQPPEPVLESEPPLPAGMKDRQELLKKRFLQEGLAAFPDYTILEMLLFFGMRTTDTNAAAHELLERFGSFSQVFQADYEQLAAVPGMTSNAAVLLKMMPQVAHRYIESLTPSADRLSSSAKIGEFLVPKFLGRTEETVLLLCFNNACQLLRCEVLSEGGLSQAVFQVRRIVETAFQCRASNVVLAHNHPAGIARPSSQDIRITEKLCRILKPVGLELLDHFIVAGTEYVSMMELGYLGVSEERQEEI